MTSIAVVGTACRYADAESPQQLWENTLAGRRAFRRLPPERLRLEDYLSEDRRQPDTLYATRAAVIEGWDFDRVRFHVAGSSHRVVDPSHWLALDIAHQALADAGFPDGAGLPAARTGVLVGNTLTGEFSRANLMRLRWPYVRRTVEATLAEQGLDREQQRSLLDALETRYKAPFPAMSEESLAGGLANTIAGRICNHFDLHGGGFVVDGACASSLLAIAQACSALLAGDLDVAIAGGVDLSLDPFELVGFARNGALSAGEMRIFDRHSDGFIPGEGCGFTVLMRTADADGMGRPVKARIRGWGISSDGSGGLTRPSPAGQVLALEHAYRRAGLAASEVAYFEAHGTGTPVGDAAELRALAQVVARAPSRSRRPAVGSIKALIGHTKAASGVAGVLKATQILAHQLLPPTFGCRDPHPELSAAEAPLRRLEEAELWSADRPLTVGVSGMGFGGLNVHLVLDRAERSRRRDWTPHERLLLSSAQDAEIFLFSAADRPSLRRQLENLVRRSAGLSRAELGDLAAMLAARASVPERPWRAALVASEAEELERGLHTLSGWLGAGEKQRLEIRRGIFFGSNAEPPRLGWLFPGQGAPDRSGGGAWSRRFEFLRPMWRDLPADPEKGEESPSTAIAQPLIVAGSLAALAVLERLGLEGSLAIGHSLGELTALSWARVFDDASVLGLAQQRGRAMQRAPADGAMYSLAARVDQVDRWLAGSSVVIAAYNRHDQTVISGAAAEVAAVVARARGAGCSTRRLRVGRAFHSPAMAAAVDELAAALDQVEIRRPQRPVLSTVSGDLLGSGEEIRRSLLAQLSRPVLFEQALHKARGRVDLWLEVGPGTVCGALLGPEDAPVVSLDAGGESLRGLLLASAAAFALGAPLDAAVLFEGRFHRPFDIDRQPRFLASPCEQAPLPAGDDGPPLSSGRAGGAVADGAFENASPGELPHTALAPPDADGLLDLVRRQVAERTELPLAAVRPEQRMLSDLHLNSLAVGQLVAAVGEQLGLPASAAPFEYADATVTEIAEALGERRRLGGSGAEAAEEAAVEGVESWIRPFAVAWTESPQPPTARASGDEPVAGSGWQVLAPAGHRLAPAVEALFAETPGRGVVLCLPAAAERGPDRAWIELCLRAVRLARAAAGSFAIVHRGGWVNGFARTFQLEYPRIPTAVIDLPFDLRGAAERVRDETLACDGFSCVRYDASGRRYQPLWRPLELDPRADLPLGPEDVLLVTGGGRGIGAECALEIARQCGVRLALVGRTPRHDEDLARRLQRFERAGIEIGYAVADVGDEAALRRAAEELEAALGPVTGLLHAAGINHPRAIGDLDADAFAATLAPKIDGWHHLLAAVDPARLRLVLTFGSVIARTGLPGEADYAMANEGLARLTEDLQGRLPGARVLGLEWSVWAGLGMGERLGHLESLSRRGITPIPLDRGVEMLLDLLRSATPSTVVVSGRLSDLAPLAGARDELPLRRFLERPRLHVPGIELISDAELSVQSDPYLNDHVLDGDPLFPAVMGLEAMAQAAMALAGSDRPPSFEKVRFSRPIAVAAAGDKVIVRIAALQRRMGVVDVVVRCSTTAFAVDHFAARCRFDDPVLDAPHERLIAAAGRAGTDLPHALCARELYGSLFFNRGRFQRVGGYRWLHAEECIAEIEPAPAEAEPWFGAYLPTALLLGDPGGRDAALHALQACVPRATVLPVGVDEVRSDGLAASGALVVSARQRSHRGDSLVYDLQITDSKGIVREIWRGLELRKIARQKSLAPRTAPRTAGPLVARQKSLAPRTAALVGPLVERYLEDLLPDVRLSVALSSGRAPGASRAVLERVFAWPADLVYRADGRPEIAPSNGGPHDWTFSAAHAGELTLAVAGAVRVGCDLEPVRSLPEGERDRLLGRLAGLARQIAEQQGEDLGRASIRVWTAVECLKKAGRSWDPPVVLEPSKAGEWLVMRSDEERILSGLLVIEEREYALAVSAGPAQGKERRAGTGVLATAIVGEERCTARRS